MNKISTFSKLIAFISLSACSVWIGSYLTRLFLVYNLFEGVDLRLQSFISEQNINGILISILPAILTHFISFILMLLAFIIFILTSKLRLKENGWLFIIVIIVLILSPFEIYLMTIDYKTINILLSQNFDANQVVLLLKERIKVLSSFPVVEVISFISIFYFIIFQPLTKLNKN
jgi:hypothetical protein